jgi:CheY-like chemotaxis protein
MSAKVSEPVILLLENEENDVFFFRRALSALDFRGQVRVVINTSQARDYLEGRGVFQDRSYYPLPDLIVSDLKMPGQTGIEFLQWLRTHTDYGRIPFVMFSGSALPQDRDDALRDGARAFFTKSGEFATTRERVREILGYLETPPPSEPSPGEEGPAS